MLDRPLHHLPTTDQPQRSTPPPATTRRVNNYQSTTRARVRQLQATPRPRQPRNRVCRCQIARPARIVLGPDVLIRQRERSCSGMSAGACSTIHTVSSLSMSGSLADPVDLTSGRDSLLRSLANQRRELAESIVLTPVDSLPFSLADREHTAFLQGLYLTDKERDQDARKNALILFG